MLHIFKAANGMTIAGQGIKILLFTAPFAGAAAFVHWYLPGQAALPISRAASRLAGALLLAPGILLWLTAVVQLLAGFPRGKLVTNGAYGICRNPIYASFILFLLPALSFLTATWVYLGVSPFLMAGVSLFIKKEEAQLRQVFGMEYEAYTRRVSRIIPFLKPQSRR